MITLDWTGLASQYVVAESAMPIYEYGCEQCGKTFEYMQSMTDPRRERCEECGGPLKRLLSTTSFQLKGGGWYKDLYASPKPAGAESKPGAASKAEGTSKPASASKPGADKPSGGSTPGAAGSKGGS